MLFLFLILMKQWNTYFGHVNTLRIFGMILMLLPDFSIQMRNIIFGYFDSDPTKENICFIINVLF